MTRALLILLLSIHLIKINSFASYTILICWFAGFLSSALLLPRRRDKNTR